MITAVQTPVSTCETVELSKDGRLFRKEVLRVGKIKYKGRVLDFTPEYLDQLVLSHQARAFDACHLVFADKDNAHTQAVENIRGEALGFERDGDKLYALVQASNDQAAELLRNNPNVGVSVRIEQPIERADGVTFPAAIQHVLVTGNPRVTGMSPWEPVDLANDDADNIIDLSTFDLAELSEATREEPAVPEPETDLEQLSAEELSELRDLLATLKGGSEVDADLLDADVEDDDAEGGDGEDYAPTDEELTALLEQIEQLPEVEAALSGDDDGIELSQQVQAQAIELAQLRAERDAERYTAFSRALAEKGVPPYITEKARRVLAPTSVELAATDPAVELYDARQALQEILLAVGDHLNLVDMRGPVAYETNADKEAARNRATEATDYLKAFGL